MAKILEPRSLRRRLSFYGPYIYFYNTDYPAFYKSIVEYINKLAIEYPDLGVFQIDWRKHLSFGQKTCIKEIHKVYLYCNKKKEYEKYFPNKNDINEVFYKAIQLYNDRIEQRAKDISSRETTKKLCPNDIDYKEKLYRRLYKKAWSRNKILKSKIIHKQNYTSCEIKNIIINILPKNTEIVHLDGSKNEENTPYFTKNTETKSNSINQDSSDKPWFYDTGSTDLPSDIFSNDIYNDSHDKNENNHENNNLFPQIESRISRYTSHKIGYIRNHSTSESEGLSCNNLNFESKQSALSSKNVQSSENYSKYKKIAPKPPSIYNIDGISSNIQPYYSHFGNVKINK